MDVMQWGEFSPVILNTVMSESSGAVIGHRIEQDQCIGNAADRGIFTFLIEAIQYAGGSTGSIYLYSCYHG